MSNCRRCGGSLISESADALDGTRPGAPLLLLLCLSCGERSSAQPRPLPLVASIRITPRPIQEDVARAARAAARPDPEEVCVNGHSRLEHAERRTRGDGHVWWHCRPCVEAQGRRRADAQREGRALARAAPTCRAGHLKADHAVEVYDKRSGTRWLRCSLCQRNARVVREHPKVKATG